MHTKLVSMPTLLKINKIIHELWRGEEDKEQRRGKRSVLMSYDAVTDVRISIVFVAAQKKFHPVARSLVSGDDVLHGKHAGLVHANVCLLRQRQNLDARSQERQLVSACRQMGNVMRKTRRFFPPRLTTPTLTPLTDSSPGRCIQLQKRHYHRLQEIPPERCQKAPHQEPDR